MVLSGAGRGLSLTKRTARKLPSEAEVLEIDVTDPEKVDAAAERLGQKWDRMDGLVHAIAYAPPNASAEGCSSQTGSRCRSRSTSPPTR